MNNNYLILGLVLFFGVLYYCFSSYSVTENFQNQAITSGQDDMNSINTLAQLARQLMSGGANLPGNLTVGGDLNVNGTIGGAVIKKGTASPDWTKIQFGDGTGWRIRYQTSDTNPVMDINDQGVLTVKSNIAVTNGSITTGTGNLNVNTSRDGGKFNTRVGAIFGHGGLFGENGALEITSKNKKVYIGPEYNIYDYSTDLIVTGKLQTLDPVQRKHQIAGHYYIRAHGYSTPLYHGFNMLWDDHATKEAIRNKYSNWDEASFHRSPLNFNQAGSNDPNWCPRSLAVFPGYKAKLYTWTGATGAALNAGDKPSYPYGEYKWTACGQGSGNTTSGNSVLAIVVSFEEAAEPPNIIGW